MDVVGLANYVAIRGDEPVEAGRAYPQIAALLSVPSGTPIWFSRHTLIKLECKHGEITFEHYSHMPDILLHGFIARARKGNALELWWIAPAGSPISAWFIVLKASVEREVFVGTFHALNRADARRLLRKALREQRLVRCQRGYTDPKSI